MVAPIKPDAPSWRAKLDDARAIALASLTPEERRARALAQSAAVIASRQRKAECCTAINMACLASLTPLEVACRAL